ncbi:TPA: hypothetical protein QFP65_001992 [Enterococcus faecium]|uniref:hypothetical protein n=1 Tax=Enterococcus faecium TaxID=1352 RepID=UPI001A07ADDF|nr:hypothetical protein [Enterococcus faecium]EMF0609512.1 hypothetical protein [Enterococcus faecium]MBZ3650051.1 hypothetical protein [Enterococcus faecium]MCD4909111.1 hypothetical protein [Enterococcus faecium]
MDYLTKEKKLNQLLNFVYDGTTVTSDLLELSQQEFASLLESATKSGYIRGASITKTKMTPIIWTDDVELTEPGAEKIHPSEKNSQSIQTTNTFNSSGDYRGATFGNNNTVTNNWNTSLDELKEYIDALPPEDQRVGRELIEIVETKDFKPNVLERFSEFLEKHPRVVTLAGNAIVWALSNTDKLPLIN